MKRLLLTVLVSAMISAVGAADPPSGKPGADNTTPAKDVTSGEQKGPGLTLKRIPHGIIGSYTSSDKTLNTACSASCDNGVSYWHWTCPSTYPYCGADCTTNPPRLWCYRE